MCGVAGFAGLKSDNNSKILLTYALGWGIDSRGGHASGFVSVNGRINVGKKLGKWQDAKDKFVFSAASGEVAMLHARWATCGKRGVDEAHPFTIRRNDKSVLYGIHNGVVYNGFESAKKHGRKILVDSQEIFHLLADGNIKGINDLDGYGVINYVLPEDPRCVRMVRLSSSSDFYACHIKTGGIVWASTERIVIEALETAELESDGEYKLDEIGTVYELRPDEILKSNKDHEKGIKFSEDKFASSRFMYYGNYGFESGRKRTKFSNSDDYWNRYNSLWDDDGIDEDPPSSNFQKELDLSDTSSDIPLIVNCENCDCEMDVEDYDRNMQEYRDIMGLPSDEDDSAILCARCIWDYPKMRRAI